MQCLAGFGFGASSIALFARVAGGIYTKADDVGDVAGMGADLFESYVGSIIAAATLATSQPDIGPWDVQLGSLMWALEKGMYVAGLLFVAASYACTVIVVGLPISIWYTVVIGLAAGMAIGKITEYYTSFDFGPVISIKDRGMTGPATVVIQGLGVGMISCVPPVIVLAAAIVSTHALAGNFGVAISLATDAYGPVADNAGGLAEMAYLGKEVRAITDSLDALGNTTAATGKGFAIGSAVLTALSLLAAFKEQIDKNGA